MNCSIFAIFFVLLSSLLSSCGREEPGTEPYIIVTSDIHVSSAGGRWQHGNVLFTDFIKKNQGRDRKPDFIFIVGDIVDNSVVTPGGIVQGGSRDHWQHDVEKYRGLCKQLSGVSIIQTLGVGHDYNGYVTRDEAVKWLGPERGFLDWQGIRFIWYDINRAAFSIEEKDHTRNVLTDEELEWLEKTIRTAKNKVILLSHIPVRTSETSKAGVWSNNTNLTIPANDMLYKVIYDNHEKILAIFNGHIHKTISSRLGTIPVYICPLLPEGSYCKVTKLKNGSVVIEPCKIDK